MTLSESTTSTNDPRPIGVFDSGVGGLTVLSSLLEKFPQESFLYLGDTARLPYGSKSPETIRKYSEQCLDFLISKNVKAIVIACNSASTQFQNSQNSSDAFVFFKNHPVLTVIGPGCEVALEKTRGRIGVLGTRATIQSHVYFLSLQKRASDKNIKIEITSSEAPLFVPLAEEGWIDDPITNLIAYRYVQPLIQAQVDTVILGCTHYPILKSAIQKCLGNQVTLVESGQAVSNELQKLFDQKLINSNLSGTKPTLHLISTDSSVQFLNLARMILKSNLHFEFEVAEI